MVGDDEREIVGLAVFKVTGTGMVNGNHWLGYIGLKYRYKLEGVFILNLGRLYIPRIGYGLILHKCIHSGGAAGSHTDIVNIFIMTVGSHFHAIIAFGQTFRALSVSVGVALYMEQSVFVSVALSYRLKRIIVGNGHKSTCKMRTMAAVGVVGVFVCGIHKDGTCRFGDGIDVVIHHLVVAAFAVNDDGAGVLHQVDVLTRRQTQGEVSRVVDRYRRQGVATH